MGQKSSVLTRGFLVLGCLFVTSTVRAQDVFAGFPREKVISLGDALRIAGGDNPLIALAEECVVAAEAEQLLIRSQILPNLDAGFNYRHHNGRLLNSQGVLRDVDLQSLYYGAGAGAYGSGTVAIPGIRLSLELGDAILAPRVASLRVAGRRLEADAARNEILLGTATRYLNLVGAGARIEAYRESLGDLDTIVKLTADFARTGQGRDADVRRAESETFLLRADLEKVREDFEVARVELARFLAIDPTMRLHPADATPPLLNWIDPAITLECLLATALADNPEIAARSVDVAREEVRLRQEQVRPWLPRIVVGYSAGEFGGGSEQVRPRFGDFHSRTDFDVLAVWTVENFGLGNRARRDRARAERGQAEARRAVTLDRTRADVVESFARLQASVVELELARRRIDLAGRAFRQDLTRARNLQGRPLETLSSVTSLAAARQAFLIAAVGYGQAQVRLVAALGRSWRF